MNKTVRNLLPLAVPLTLLITASLAVGHGGEEHSATGHGPESIDLKERYAVQGKKAAVIFPHHQHQAVAPCAGCHKNQEGGGELVVSFDNMSGTRNDFHTKFCWPCHKAEKVAKGTSCSTCHKKQ